MQDEPDGRSNSGPPAPTQEPQRAAQLQQGGRQQQGPRGQQWPTTTTSSAAAAATTAFLEVEQRLLPASAPEPPGGLGGGAGDRGEEGVDGGSGGSGGGGDGAGVGRSGGVRGQVCLVPAPGKRQPGDFLSYARQFFFPNLSTPA